MAEVWRQPHSTHACYGVSIMIFQLEVCLDSFQYEEAAELCMRTVEREPDSVQVLEEVGPVLLELGHTDRALKVSSHEGNGMV